MKTYLKSLLALIMTCGFAVLSWAADLTATAFGQTYDYLFVGSAEEGGNEYTTVANWRNADGTELTLTNVPGLYGTTDNGKMLLHGDNILVAEADGYKTVTVGSDFADYLAGKDLQIGVAKGVHLKDITIDDFSGDCDIRVDATSKMTIDSMFIEIINTFNKADIYVASADGLTVNGNISQQGTFNYTFGAAGSVAYTGALSVAKLATATHHIVSVEGLDLGDSTVGTTKTLTRRLISFASQSGLTFTIAALNGMTQDANLDTVGDYTLDVTSTGVDLKYVVYGTEDVTDPDPGTGDGETGGETTDPDTGDGGGEDGGEGESGGETNPDTGDDADGDGEDSGGTGGETTEPTDPDTGDSGTTTPDTTIPEAEENLVAEWINFGELTVEDGSFTVTGKDGETSYTLTAGLGFQQQYQILDDGSLYVAGNGYTISLAGTPLASASQVTIEAVVSRLSASKQWCVGGVTVTANSSDHHYLQFLNYPERSIFAHGTLAEAQPASGVSVRYAMGTSMYSNDYGTIPENVFAGEEASTKHTLTFAYDLNDTYYATIDKGVYVLTAPDVRVSNATLKEISFGNDYNTSAGCVPNNMIVASDGTQTLKETFGAGPMVIHAIRIYSDVKQYEQLPRVWTGAGDGVTWSSAANWEGGRVPGSSDVAEFTITADDLDADGYCLINVDADATVKQLVVKTELGTMPVFGIGSTASATLTVTEAIDSQAHLSLQSVVTTADTTVTLPESGVLNVNVAETSAMKSFTGATVNVTGGGTLSGDWIKNYDGPITLNGATLDAGTSSFTLTANQQYIAASGTSTLKIYNGSDSSVKADTDTAATVQVKSGATLHLYGRDFGGFWSTYKGETVRVYVAGTLIAESYDSNPGCFSAMMVLADGGIVQGGDASTDSIHFYSAGSTTNPNIRVLENATAEWRDYLWWNNHNLFIETQNGATLNLSATFKGNGSDDHIYKLGSGKLCISGEQADRTGNIIVEAGTLQLTGAGSLGSGSVTVNSGMFEVVATATKEVDNTISASLGMLKTSGSATVTFSGAVTAATTVIDTDTTFTGAVNLGAVTIAEGKTLTVPASATFTSVTGPGNLVVSGTGALRLLGVTFGETLPTITISAGATVRLTEAQKATLGANLVNNGTLSLATNTAFGKIFTYVFNGGTATYETISNWDCFNGATLTDKAPNTNGSNKWEPILLDGNQMLIAAGEDGYKTVNAGELEGWNLRLGITNGAHLKATSTRCVYGDAGEKWIYIDDDSKLTVTTLSSNDSNNHGTTLHIYAEEGFEVTDEVTNNHALAYTYHLYENGSAVYTGGLGSAGNQTIASMTLDVGTPSLRKEVKTRKLIGFASQTSQTFSITASGVTMTGATPTATTTPETALTGDEAVGTYRGYTVTEGDNQGYFVEYVAYKPIDNLIAIWDNFEGLTEATEGLAPSVGFTHTQNSITLDGATLKFYKEGGSETAGVLSTGTTTAPRIDLAEGDTTVNVGHDNFPITVVMAIEAPVDSTQVGKPFVHQAHATNTSNGIGIALQSTDYICGTWMNDIYSNGAHKWEITNLSRTETLYLLFTNMSGGSRVGFVADGTVTWKNCFTSSLRASSLDATDIFFGNYQGADADGMDFKLKSVALLAGTGTSLNSSILACVERMEADAQGRTTVPTWVGTTTDGANTGTWDKVVENKPWQLGKEAVAFEDNMDVVFTDIKDATSATVTIGANVSPASILVENKATAYTLTPNGGVIQGGITITKRGAGSLTFGAISGQATDIGELIIEEGMVVSANNALQKSDKFGPKLTIKGGTLDLNNSFAYDTNATRQLWLTKSLIMLGGSARAAEIKNGNIVPYTTDETAMTFLEYVGTYGDGQKSPAATFATNLAGAFNPNTRPRNVVVGEGAKVDADGRAVDYDLIMTGTLGSWDDYDGITLFKQGEGVLKIAAQNNLPGLTIEAGTVMIGHANAFSTTTTIGVGATLDLNGFALESGVTVTGTGTLTNSSTTELTLTPAQLITFTGTVEGNIKIAVDLSKVLIGGKLYTFAVDSSKVDITGAIPDYLSEFLTYDATTGVVKETYSALPYQITWMPMGDSITEGETYMGPATDAANYTPRSDGTDGGYRYQLWKYLEAGNQDTLSVGYRSGHQGTDEATNNPDWAWHCGLYGGIVNPISYAGAQNFNVEASYEHVGYPEVVTLMLGINDLSYIDNAGGTELEVYAAWKTLVDKLAKNRPHTKVVVSTLFPLTPTNESYSRAPVFNAALREDAENGTGPFENANVLFADVNQWAFNGEYQADCFKPTDGLHPNLKGSKIFAQAFRLGILKALDAIRKDAMAITQVHNATAGKIAVRLNKPIKTLTSANLTLSGTDVRGTAVALTLANGALDATDKYVVTFDTTETLMGGTYTATFTGTFTDALDVAHTNLSLTADGAKMDIVGSGAEANVEANFLKGFKRISTTTLTNNDNYNGAGPATENVTTGETVTQPISRVGYYMELKRPGKPAQFVWVSMAADAFGRDVTKVGIPTETTGAHKAIVANLSVYGNRGNFEKSVTNGRGIIEFTPWSWTATDQSGYVNEARGGHFGWNDTLETAAGTLKGCMQVAHIVEGQDGTWREPAAETLFAFNHFNTDTQTDLGIGSFAPMWNNSGSSKFSGMYDWTEFSSKSGYTNYFPSAYQVKKIEVWVEEATTATWTGTTSGDWNTTSNWEGNAVPSATAIISLSADATHTLTLTEGIYHNVFTGAGALAIADGAEVTLTAENTHTGGLTLGANATVVVPDIDNLGDGTLTGETTSTIAADGFIPATTFRNNWANIIKVMNISNVDLSNFTSLSTADGLLELENVMGYDFKATPAPTFANVKLTGEGLQFGNGTETDTSRATIMITKLSGDGKFKWTGYGSKAWEYTLLFSDVSAFDGAFVVNSPATVTDDRTAIVIGSTAATTTATDQKITFCGNVTLGGATFAAEAGLVVNSGTTFTIGEKLATMASPITWPTGDNATVGFRVSAWADGVTEATIMTVPEGTGTPENAVVYVGEATTPSTMEVVCDGTALKVRGTKTWSPAATTESATWSNVWGYTTSTTDDLTIVLTDDLTLTIDTAVSVGALTVKRAEGIETTPTLTLTNGGNLTTTSVTLNDVIYVPGVTTITTPYAGNGKVVISGLTAITETQIATTSFSGNDWTGTLCIKDSTNEKNLVHLENLSTANSFLELNNVKGWIGESITIEQLIISDGETTDGFCFSNGTSSAPGFTFTIDKLSGSGTIHGTTNTSKHWQYHYVVKDISGFTGNIDMTDGNAGNATAFTIGTPPENYSRVNKAITILGNETVTLVEGQTWKAADGVVVASGATFGGAGTIDCALTFADGVTYAKATSTEALTINGNLICDGTLNVTLPEETELPVDILAVSGDNYTVTSEPAFVNVTIGGVAQEDIIVTKNATSTALTLSVSATSQDWSPNAGSDPVTWGTTGTGSWTAANAPTSKDTVVIRISGDTTIALPTGETTIHVLRVCYAEGVTSGTLTFTGGKLITSMAVIDADTNVSGTTTTLGSAEIATDVTLTAKATNFASVSGDGTLYLTAGTLVHSDTALHYGLTIHVAKGATFKATEDVAAASGTDFILDGGAIFTIPAQKWVNVPITVAENTEPAKIYGASQGNDTAFKGNIILNGDLELANGGDGGGNKYRIDGVISGKGKLIVNDVNNPAVDALNSSSIQLTGDNTFTGGLVIGAGVVLNTTQATSVGAGDIVIAETGALKNNVAITIPAGKKLAGGGTVTGAVTFADGAILDATEGDPTIDGTVTFTTNLNVALPALAATTTEATKVLAGPDGTAPTDVTYTFTIGGAAFDGNASWDATGDLYVTPAVTVPGTTVLPNPETPGATVNVPLTEPVVQKILTELKKHEGVTTITEVKVTSADGKTQLDSHSAEAAHLFTEVVSVTPDETTEDTTDGKATITYDFGIEKFMVKNIGGTLHIVLKAKVKGGTGTDYAPDTVVKVMKGETDVEAVEIDSPLANDSDATGVKWFKIPLSKATGQGTHPFTIKAEKK